MMEQADDGFLIVVRMIANALRIVGQIRGLVVRLSPSLTAAPMSMNLASTNRLYDGDAPGGECNALGVQHRGLKRARKSGAVPVRYIAMA